MSVDRLLLPEIDYGIEMGCGQLIGSGQTADVIALDANRVRKQFNAGIPGDVARREAANTRIATEAGLPVPAVHDVTTVEGQSAIIYDRVDGSSMLSELLSSPWTLRRNAHRLAALHATIHSVRPTGGRSLRERWRQNLDDAPGLTPRTRRKLRSRLDALPEGSALCHGDFHPDNVLLTDDGPVVIDWLDAGTGHPAADVARTSLILRFAGCPRSRVLAVLLRFVRRLYLRHYCGRRDVSRSQIRQWELPIAAARLTENVPEAPHLRSFIRSRISEE